MLLAITKISSSNVGRLDSPLPSVNGLGKQYLRLTHLPLPLCVFSFATLGAMIAPRIYLDRLLWAYLAVFASLCLASYSFDELKDRPLRTTIPERQLNVLGWTGLTISILTGVYLAATINLLLLAWIPPSAFIILAYNRELFKGRFHNGNMFALGWGGIPVLGSYFLQTLTISLSALFAAAATIVFSLAIWNLNHEFRPELNTIREMASRLDGEAVAARRSMLRRIWSITKILCYAITLFTVALSYYRFFP